MHTITHTHTHTHTHARTHTHTHTHTHTPEKEALRVNSDTVEDVHSLRVGHAQESQAHFGQKGHVADHAQEPGKQGCRSG
jgi:hypothetical protein